MTKRSYTPHRTDGNQKEVVKALKKIGASVLDIHDIGHGAPDLLVGYLAINVLMEVKDGRKPPSRRILTPDEQIFFDNWRGPIYIVYSGADAVNLIERLTAEDDGIPF